MAYKTEHRMSQRQGYDSMFESYTITIASNFAVIAIANGQMLRKIKCKLKMVALFF